MAIDSQHWYKKDGTPFYSIIGKNGNERAVTIRDAREIGAVPSVTTVLGILAKPALEAWKVRQGILAALTMPRNDGESEPDYMARIEVDAREQAKKAAEEGTRIHDAIDRAYKGTAYPKEYTDHVSATMAEVRRLFPKVEDWIAEKSFAHASGFGGKVDLHSPSTGIVIDYKGKDGDFSDGKKLAYDQHYQLAAYQFGLSLAPAVCVNIFVSRTHPGCVASHVWDVSDVEHGLDVFKNALSTWQAIRKYRL